MEKEDIIQFNVYLPRELVDRFKRMIALKYQTHQHGLLSYEVKVALAQYLAMSNTQTQNTQATIKADKTNPIPQIYRLKEQIKQYLVDSNLYEEEPQFVPSKLLDQAIGALRGTDSRTLYKWKKLLHQYGCLKSVGVNQWEIL
jgi:hypothetical protein